MTIVLRWQIKAVGIWCGRAQMARPISELVALWRDHRRSGVLAAGQRNDPR
jgi:hypothetical protein